MMKTVLHNSPHKIGNYFFSITILWGSYIYVSPKAVSIIYSFLKVSHDENEFYKIIQREMEGDSTLSIFLYDVSCD